MTHKRRIARGLQLLAGAALSCGLLSTAEQATAQSPQRMANPYYSSSYSPGYSATPSANGARSAGSGAANAAATLGEGQVVYPTAASNFAIGSVPAQVAPVVNAKGLPCDRVAALGAALRVTTLDDAYRAGVAAVDASPTNRVADLPVQAGPTSSPSLEPSPFTPPTNAVRMPSYATINPHTVATTRGLRRDTAVQPVAWLSAASRSTPPTQAANPRLPTMQQVPPELTMPQGTNPLRELSTRSTTFETHDTGGGVVGNPLR